MLTVTGVLSLPSPIWKSMSGELGHTRSSTSIGRSRLLLRSTAASAGRCCEIASKLPSTLNSTGLASACDVMLSEANARKQLV